MEHLTLSACCGFLLLAMSSSAAADVQADYDACNAALERKNWDVGVQYCSQVIQSEEITGQALVNAFVLRCWAKIELNCLDEAIADCDQAIRLNPVDTNAYNNRCYAYWTKGEPDRAIDDCTEALRLDPDLTFAYGNRGVAYFNKGQYDRAIQDYDRALQIDPNLNVYHDRGNAYAFKGQYEQAVQDYGQALQLNPRYVKSIRARGHAYFDLAQFDAAAKDLEHAAALEPEGEYLGYDLLWLFLARQRGGGKTQGMDAVTLDLGKWPGPILRYMRGELSEAELQGAAQHSEPKIQNDQTCEVHFYVGESALIAAQPDVARTHFEHAVAMCPKTFIEHQGALAELARLGQ